MWSVLGKEKKVYVNGPGHMTKMATMPIYIKNLQKIFSCRTNIPIIMKFGMEHYILKLYRVYINVDPGLPLTYFTTMSNFAKLFVLIVSTDIR